MAAVADWICHLVAALLDPLPGLSEPPLALRSRAHCAPSIGTLRAAPGVGLDSFTAAALRCAFAAQAALPFHPFRNRKLPRPARKPTGRARAKHGTTRGRETSSGQSHRSRARCFACRPQTPQYRRSPAAFPLGNRWPSAHGTADQPASPFVSRFSPTHRRSAAACAGRARPRRPARRRAWPPPASDASEKFGVALARLTPGLCPQTRLQG